MKIKEKLINGTFCRRLNRFLAEISLEDNEKALAHVPDPGRLKELLVPKAKILVREEYQKQKSPRKTKYSLIYVKTDNTWVNIESQFTNVLFYNDFHLFPDFKDYTIKRKEYNYKNSRIDFLLTKNNDKRALVEVKGVTLVQDSIALFPDAPTTRGTKHLEDLINATKEGLEAYIVFIVKRNDANQLAPNWQTDKKFAETLKKAINAGVKVIAYKYLFKPTQKEIKFCGKIKFTLDAKKTVN